MNLKSFEENMNAFLFKEHQAFVTYLQTLKQKGLTINDAEKYVKLKNKQLRKGIAEIPEPVTRNCSCGALMHLLPVNVTPGTRVEDDSKSVWICSNRECMNTIYNKESIKELRFKGGK